MHHKKGKPHIKAVNELSKKGGLAVAKPTGDDEEMKEAQSEFNEAEIAKLKTVAQLETWILKLKQDLLADVF